MDPVLLKAVEAIEELNFHKFRGRAEGSEDIGQRITGSPREAASQDSGRCGYGGS